MVTYRMDNDSFLAAIEHFGQDTPYEPEFKFAKPGLVGALPTVIEVGFRHKESGVVYGIPPAR